MIDNDWWIATIEPSADAVADDGSGDYLYLLKIEHTYPYDRSESNFKVSLTGDLSIVAKEPFSVVGAERSDADLAILYPDWTPPLIWDDPSTFPDQNDPTTYNGEWTFQVLVPATSDFTMWDGDADHGSYEDSNFRDTDDPDSEGVPDWFQGVANDEGVSQGPFGAGIGAPPDDTFNFNGTISQIRRLRSPSVYFVVEAPNGELYPGMNPSGNQEVEQFRVTKDPLATRDDADYGPGFVGDDGVTTVPADPPQWDAGVWTVRIYGYDLANITVFRFDHATGGNPSHSIGDRVWLDLDKDALQDVGEPSIQGVEVKLYADRGQSDGTNNPDGIFCPEDVYPTGCGADGPDPLMGTQSTNAGWSIAADGGIRNYDYLGLCADSYWVDVVESTLPPNLTLTTNNEPYTGPAGGGVPYPLGANVPVGQGEDHDFADFGYVPCEECECIWPDDPRVQADVQWWITPDPDPNIPGTVTIRTTLNRAFADTAYGPNSTITGWPGKRGRRFKHVWTSDNLEMELYDAAGQMVMKLGIDLLDEIVKDQTYATAGVLGGDGYCQLPAGTCADFVVGDPKTSISENLNAIPWTDLTNSPMVNPDYTGSAEPAWIWDTWYEITIDLAVFGDAGFGYPYLWALHASPSKTGDPNPDCIMECWDVCIDEQLPISAPASAAKGKKAR
jgi:hypothetical protein